MFKTKCIQKELYWNWESELDLILDVSEIWNKRTLCENIFKDSA